VFVMTLQSDFFLTGVADTASQVVVAFSGISTSLFLGMPGSFNLLKSSSPSGAALNSHNIKEATNTSTVLQLQTTFSILSINKLSPLMLNYLQEFIPSI